MKKLSPNATKLEMYGNVKFYLFSKVSRLRPSTHEDIGMTDKKSHRKIARSYNV